MIDLNTCGKRHETF